MKKLVIVGKSGCTHCDMAKRLCESQGFGYTYKTIHEDVSVQQLEEIAGGAVRTVPQIYIEEQGLYTYIGGFTEFRQYVQMNRPDDFRPYQGQDIL